MDKWNVQPLKKVNNIEFGMKRAMVRQTLSVEAKEFKKSKYSKVTTDDFGFCHVFYNAEDECEAVEIFDDITVYIGDMLVFPGTISDVKAIFNDLEKESDDYISKSQSVGIYAPRGIIESILFAVEGYYE